MGLSNFASPSDGVLPIIVMNTVMSVAILKRMARAFLELVGISTWVAGSNMEENPSTSNEACTSRRRKVRGVSNIKFKSSNFALAGDKTSKTKSSGMECCVCLSKFEEEEEVSELSCKHFFHKKCLDKWFDNHHSTCPLCRSLH